MTFKKLRKARRLMPQWLTQGQDIPDLRGRDSRRHRKVSVWQLRALGELHAWQQREVLQQVDTLVQFAGFPRSGHSLIGSILDAHPDARVAHELDAMGLVEQRFSKRAILGLIDKKALEFSYHGRYWNGYCYYVEGAGHLADTPPRVMGDKKGDMAVRRIAKQPDLLKRLNNLSDLRKKWICVLRNPFDNIATMSLRKSRVYDRLRAQSASSAEFDAKLKQAQADNEIASQPLSDQIDEYERLCKAVMSIQNATPASNWFELSHETFSASPDTHIRAMLDFLGLSIDEGYVSRCSSLVKPSSNWSRERLSWRPSDIARVQSLISSYPFLSCYSDDPWQVS